MKTIKLTQGYETIVDDEDYERLSKFKWCISGDKHYAIRAVGPRYNRTFLWMHKEVLGIDGSQGGDHINGDKLDNRKCNLRVATIANNSQNRPLQSNNTSGYKGVCYSKGKWQAYIKNKGQKINLGTFETKLEAAQVYNKAARTFFGQFAHLNQL